MQFGFALVFIATLVDIAQSAPWQFSLWPKAANDEQRSYYDVLEVPRSASSLEIGQAYRKLAVQWHPEKNHQDPAFAVERFREVAAAYEVLSDPARRRQYDGGGVPGFKDPQDVYNEAFGGFGTSLFSDPWFKYSLFDSFTSPWHLFDKTFGIDGMFPDLRPMRTSIPRKSQQMSYSYSSTPEGSKSRRSETTVENGKRVTRIIERDGATETETVEEQEGDGEVKRTIDTKQVAGDPQLLPPSSSRAHAPAPAQTLLAGPSYARPPAPALTHPGTQYSTASINQAPGAAYMAQSVYAPSPAFVSPSFYPQAPTYMPPAPYQYQASYIR